MSTVNTRRHHSKTPRRRSVAHGGQSPARETTGTVTSEHQKADQQLTIEDVAQRLRTTERFVRTLIEERRIAYTKLGPGKRSPVRISEDVLQTFIAEHTIEADS